MKKLLLGAFVLSTVLYAGSYRDGMYRGYHNNEVEVEFTLKGDKVESAKYKTLTYKGVDYLKDATVKRLKDQYEALLTYAVGKNVNEAMEAMYTPEKIEMAGATIRATKVRAAIKDGLIHDAYKPAK